MSSTPLVPQASVPRVSLVLLSDRLLADGRDVLGAEALEHPASALSFVHVLGMDRYENSSPFDLRLVLLGLDLRDAETDEHAGKPSGGRAGADAGERRH